MTSNQQNTQHNAWRTLSNALCHNLFLRHAPSLYSKLMSGEAGDLEPAVVLAELADPLACGMYLSSNWNQMNEVIGFPLESVRGEVEPIVLQLVDLYYDKPEPALKMIYHCQLTTPDYNHYFRIGSMAFAVEIVSRLCKIDPDFYANPMNLFQDALEVVIWLSKRCHEDKPGHPLYAIASEFAPAQEAAYMKSLEFIKKSIA